MATYLAHEVETTSGGNVSCPAGSNRAGVFFIISEDNASSWSVTALTWGATDVLPNYIGGVELNNGTTNFRIDAYWVDETIIAARSGSAVSWTLSESVTGAIGYFVFASGVPTLSPSFVTESSTSATSLSKSITVPSDGFLAAAAIVDYDAGNTDVTWSNATEANDANQTTIFRRSLAYGTAGGSITPQASWTNAQEAALMVVALGASGSVAPIVAYYSMQD